MHQSWTFIVTETPLLWELEPQDLYTDLPFSAPQPTLQAVPAHQPLGIDD